MLRLLMCDVLMRTHHPLSPFSRPILPPSKLTLNVFRLLSFNVPVSPFSTDHESPFTCLRSGICALELITFSNLGFPY